MAKLNSEDRKTMILFVRNLKINGCGLEDIQKAILDEFGVTFCAKSVYYYLNKAFQKEWLEKLQRENEIMERWYREGSAPDNINFREELAEAMYDAIVHNENTRYNYLKKHL